MPPQLTNVPTAYCRLTDDPKNTAMGKVIGVTIIDGVGQLQVHPGGFLSGPGQAIIVLRPQNTKLYSADNVREIVITAVSYSWIDPNAPPPAADSPAEIIKMAAALGAASASSK